MTYQVIARKWRPQTFEEITGQEPITRTLTNALKYERLHHAYLFSGARGVGKTTTARILAKALNCHKTDKPNLTPCSVADPDACSSCVEISESRSMDVLEIDAASHTGIDQVRDTIIEGVNVNPARDRYKVFIIDEVHQLSRPAFNALLKTIEEPPPNVVFIMATTELRKVPDTILSRCQEFQFRIIPTQKILDRLKLIAEAEKIDIIDEALRELARSGDGSMRDAQSNFDQVISFSGAKISVDDVSSALGLASIEALSRVIRAIADNNSRELLEAVDELVAQGQDLRSFTRDLLSLWRDLLVFKIAGMSDALLETSILDTTRAEGWASAFSEADLLRFFNSLSETETQLKDATQPRFTLEIGLIKLVEMHKVQSVESLIERLERLGSDAGPGEPDGRDRPEPRVGQAAAAPEKKTSESDPVAAAADPVSVDEVVSRPVARLSIAESIAAMPVRLPSISSDELEHFDDPRLDAEYENQLIRSGDPIAPIEAAMDFVHSLMGDNRGAEPTASEGAGRDRGVVSAAAVAPAKISIELPQRQEQPDDEFPAPLDDLATDEDLLDYAQGHPAVKRVLRVFRGRITKVTRA